MSKLFNVSGVCREFKQELTMPVKADTPKQAEELAEGYYKQTRFNIDPKTIKAEEIPES